MSTIPTGFTPAKPINSNQTGPHKDLIAIVEKHRKTIFRKPINLHTQQAFEQAYTYWQTQHCPPVILDSACGTAHSSLYFATQNLDYLVIGIDQSQHRLQKQTQIPDNCLLLRAECTDFWRLAKQQQWFFDRHYLLYPNPWPKKQHLQRRWHGHPAFIDLISISRTIELRTNWQLYADEFCLALQYINQQPCKQQLLQINTGITAFEEKYRLSQHDLWQVFYSTNRL